MKVGKFLPDILFKETVVHTNAPCGQRADFINVKASAVGRSLCALQVHSSFLPSVKRERYLPRLHDPTTEPDVPSPSRLPFFDIRSTIFLPSILGLPCNFFPSAVPSIILNFCLLPVTYLRAIYTLRNMIVLCEEHKFKNYT